MTDEQDAAVQRLAVERGIPISTAICRLVEESLKRGTARRQAAAAAVIGAHASGIRDVSARDDLHLADGLT